MPPNSTVGVAEPTVEQRVVEKEPYRAKIVWFNVMLFVYLHGAAFYGLYLAVTSAKITTVFFSIFLGMFAALGITGGSHRLWAHRSYKARLPLRILLCILASVAGQNDIYEWARDHRVHHKFTETNADPHNIKRGFFFAHMGWLMSKKHPEVFSKGKTVYLDDLLADPVVRFHKKYYIPMFITCSFLLPTLIPTWWGESAWNAYFITAMLRYCLSLHITWLVNSAAHKYGYRPFDKHIEARESIFVCYVAQGEGWHNYHHAFPYDYAASELGYKLNLTKMFIDLMAVLGMVYDRKMVTKEMIRHRKLKSGDGTRLEDEEKEGNLDKKVASD